MIRFDLNTHIYRPPVQVFAFVATPENEFQWQYGTLASAQISRGEMGLGTLFRAVNHLLGRRTEIVYEVTVFEPNQRYGFKSISGPVDSYTLYTFEIAQGGTKINLSTETTTGDTLKPSHAVVEKKLKKQYRENLAMLKSILEAHPVLRA